jgi:hypothetical protein
VGAQDVDGDAAQDGKVLRLVILARAGIIMRSGSARPVGSSGMFFWR